MAYQVLHLLSYPGGGVPHPDLARQGVPCDGVLPSGIWDQGTPSPIWDLGLGYPSTWNMGLGYPSIWDMGLGYPLVRDLLLVTGVSPPPRKDMGPVEVLWDGNIMGWRQGTPLLTDRHL